MLAIFRRLLCLLAFGMYCGFAHATYILQIDTGFLRSTQATIAFDLVDGAPEHTAIAFGPLKVDGVETSLPGQIADDLFYQSLSRSILLGDMLEISFGQSLSSTPDSTYLPDSFAIFLLGQDGMPLFSTSDPVGADSLLQWDVGRAGPLVFYGQLRQFDSPSAVPEPNTLLLIVPIIAILFARGASKKRMALVGLLTVNLAADAAPSISGATDLGAQLEVTVSGLVFNRSTGTFDSNVVIRNKSTAALNRPFTVAALSLPTNVVLTNATSVAQEGVPFVTLDGNGSLLPGASISVPLKFVNYSNTAFRFDLRVVRLTQPVPPEAVIMGPDANSNGVRDDLEPLLISRYGSSPALKSAAHGVLAAMRNALGQTGSVELAFSSSVRLNRAFDCMIQTAGLDQGIQQNKFLRDQMLNSRDRIATWIGRMDLLAGQSISTGDTNPCAN